MLERLDEETPVSQQSSSQPVETAVVWAVSPCYASFYLRGIASAQRLELDPSSRTSKWVMARQIRTRRAETALS